jgi:hypothetical protein
MCARGDLDPMWLVSMAVTESDARASRAAKSEELFDLARDSSETHDGARRSDIRLQRAP